ncbi:phospholipid-transporting ATPase IC-like [Bombina bombina]|uniref:phospholipid-transporting ATPase IC-like n=1 Tax=Bombina bombina TaxID=8345 RepID=UPI00235A5BCD|nr:phospholipid-transporting ATPase IC-like [Bombina bombina]
MYFSDYSWEVKANNRSFHKTAKKKGFLCFQKNKYANNRIKTAKYNVLTFIPLNLFEQFHRAYVIYFLCVFILQCIPQISTFNWIVFLIPLLCILLVRALRDLIDDIARHRSDKLINNKPCKILEGQSLQVKKWKHIQVGDIVCVQKDDFVPADMLLLYSTEPNSLCYVETAGIDGETNLKFRQSLAVTHSALNSESALADFDGLVTCEFPNVNLHKFVGTLAWKDKTYPLNNDNILLRGCRIRNTLSCYGLVIYAGFDTKIMKNSGRVCLKTSRLDSVINKTVIYVRIAVMLICSSFFLAIGAGVWDYRYLKKHTYLPAHPTMSSATFGFTVFWSYSTAMGITSGTEEDNKFPEVRFDWNKYADCGFKFYDQSLVDEVRKDEDPLIREFFKMIALCHTVMVDERPGSLVYQAASPDEEALVTAARNFGYVFLSRTQDTITISELGIEKTYRSLAVLDFSSVRKRMSILVREQDGKIKLYTKGADDIILQRIHASCQTDILVGALDGFAVETLRTLCLAYKEVTESDYAKWISKHQEASVLLQNREERLEEVYEEIETDLQLLGATAIEDKLQDGVPETIQLMKDGNIKIWMLTGDKQETAVNIAYSCHLLSDNMEIIDESSLWSLINDSVEGASGGNKLADFPESEVSWNHRALVVTGDCLSRVMDSDSEQMPEVPWWKNMAGILKRMGKIRQINNTKLAFLELACQCHSVICCRVTPKQKASIVELVKNNKKLVTLAIGDGGNDVNMIRTAHIGVGINGKEGVQAVLASDFSVAQFSYLQRLLFVHGRWSCLRLSSFLCYYNYKTFASLIHNIWLAFFSCFTTLPVYDTWFLLFNAMLYTLYPTFCIGILNKLAYLKKTIGRKIVSFVLLTDGDTWFPAVLNKNTGEPSGDMDSRSSLQHPELYIITQKDSHIGLRVLWYVLYGCYTSLVMFFIPFGAFYDSAGPGGIFDYQVFVFTMGIICIFAVLSEVPVKQKSQEVCTEFRRAATTRRSSYAFSHSQGYGDLLSSGRSLRKTQTQQGGANQQETQEKNSNSI